MPSLLQISYADCGGVIPQETYDKACVFTLEEAIESCNKIGCVVVSAAAGVAGAEGESRALGG